MPGLPKFLRDIRFHIFYGLVQKRGYHLVTLGDQSYGLQWTICPDGLSAHSVVYSGGAGEDVSFEHALVKRVGCSIVLCDPSPTGLKTMSLPKNKLSQIQFLPMALARKAGKLKMAPPPAGDVSWHAQVDASAELEVPCSDLGTLMAQFGHSHIDLLKLDIEGCEYEVIDDILERRIPVRQICVEFHHGIVPGVRRSQTIRSILKLLGHGYKLVCRDCANHTFVFGAST